MRGAYYSENDPFAAAWLRELIKEGVIAPGDVDERDIRDVRPDELFGYKQWHLFAGIGGWSRALRLAGWPDSRPVLTVSCPCQPFSEAGKGAGVVDERHLWPSAFHIVHGLRDKVPTVFGEQVSAAVKHGWWDLVADDLEGIGYEVWAKDFPACSVGAWHKRQRLYFAAQGMDDATGERRQPESNGGGSEFARDGASECRGESCAGSGVECVAESNQHERGQVGADSRGLGEGSRAQGMEQRSVRGGDEFVANAERSERRPGGVFGRCETDETSGSGTPAQFAGDSEDGIVADPPDLRRIERRDSASITLQGERPERAGEHAEAGHSGELSRGLEGLCGVGGGMDDSQSTRRGIFDSENIGPSDAQVNASSDPGNSIDDRCRSDAGGMGDSDPARSQGRWLSGPVGSWNSRGECAAGEAGSTFWSSAVWLPCRDGKLRPVEGAAQPSPESLVDGLSSDMGLVRLENYPDREDAAAYIYAPLIQKGRARVGRLRGYGNAIVPPAAAEFIAAFLEAK